MMKLHMKNNVSLFALLTLIGSLFLSGCSKQKTKTNMNFSELRNCAGSYLKKQKLQEAAGMLEEAVTKYPDEQDIHKLKIILADIYFKLEQYPSAYQMYQSYAQQYPSHTRAEYSKYQAILAKYYQTLKVDCDQTLTTETINLCKDYAANPSYKKYAQDVIDIQNTCEHKLINKEIYVFNFYLSQEKFDAAKSRLSYIKEKFLTNQPSLEPRLCYLECKLAKKTNDERTYVENMSLLNERYPTSQFTRMTQDLANKPIFIF